LRGGEPGLSRVYRRAVRRFFTVLLDSVLVALAVSALTVVAAVLFVATLFGILGSIIAAIALIVWWLRPGARRGWIT
jgi:preprotein translocase subunit SecF